MIDLSEQFINATRKRHEANLGGNSVVMNMQYENIVKIALKISKEKQAKKILANLLDSDEAYVSLGAAAACLGLKINSARAKKVLKKLSKRKDIGIDSLTAEMTLKHGVSDLRTREL